MLQQDVRLVLLRAVRGDDRAFDRTVHGLAGATQVNIEMVRWMDAWFEFDDATPSPEGYDVFTVGYVIADGPVFLSIAAEQTPEGYRAITHIPVQLIQSREPLVAGL